MNNLHEIFLTSAFVGLVKRLEQLELTELVIPLTLGPRVRHVAPSAPFPILMRVSGSAVYY